MKSHSQTTGALCLAASVPLTCDGLPDDLVVAYAAGADGARSDGQEDDILLAQPAITEPDDPAAWSGNRNRICRWTYHLSESEARRIDGPDRILCGAADDILARCRCGDCAAA